VYEIGLIFIHQSMHYGLYPDITVKQCLTGVYLPAPPNVMVFYHPHPVQKCQHHGLRAVEHIVVYCGRQPNELVSFSTNMKVKHCLPFRIHVQSLH
jgi:hypothetical protein